MLTPTKKAVLFWCLPYFEIKVPMNPLYNPKWQFISNLRPKFVFI